MHSGGYDLIAASHFTVLATEFGSHIRLRLEWQLRIGYEIESLAAEATLAKEKAKREGESAVLPRAKVHKTVLEELTLVWPLPGLVFAFQQAIKLNDKCHHFDGVFFITDFLGDATPISRLWGHGENRPSIGFP
jgi:hypothetical protein